MALHFSLRRKNCVRAIMVKCRLAKYRCMLPTCMKIKLSQRRLACIVLAAFGLVIIPIVNIFLQMQLSEDSKLQRQHQDSFRLEQRLKTVEESVASGRHAIEVIENIKANISREIDRMLRLSVVEKTLLKKPNITEAASFGFEMRVSVADNQNITADKSNEPSVATTRNSNFGGINDDCREVFYSTNVTDINVCTRSLLKTIMFAASFRTSCNFCCPTSFYQVLNLYRKLSFDHTDKGRWPQSISAAQQQWTSVRPLHVMIVPHSHNDPGWLKTVDQYYESETKQILSSSVSALTRYKNVSFIWAEISYLSMWWNGASAKSRQLLQAMVDSGRLELVTGGWVMNDEANTHYYAMIDQMIEGHEWIRVNLNGTTVKPQSGWAIDPFGLSPTMAFILKRMGMKQMVIQRTHFAVKRELARQKSLEFYWRQSFDHKIDTDIFCHLMPFVPYTIHDTCGPDPSICSQFDFRHLPQLGGSSRFPPPPAVTNENVNDRAVILVDQYKKKAEFFRSDVLLVPLGDDFRYASEAEWTAQVTNYEMIMKHVNVRLNDFGVVLKWGTVGDYFDLLRTHTTHENNQYPTLSGDFFTYADRLDNYWSGYYTSRPFYKRLSRIFESRLRAAELMFSWLMTRVQSSYGNSNSSSVAQLINLLFTELVLSRRRLGLFQHHDGITGTARTAVVDDYGARMISGINSCNRIIGTSLSVTLLIARYKNIQHEQRKSGMGWIYPSAIWHISSSLLNSEETFLKHDSMPTKNVLFLSVDRRKTKVSLPPSYRRIVIYNSLAWERVEMVNLNYRSCRGSRICFTGNMCLLNLQKVFSLFIQVRLRVSRPYIRLSTFNNVNSSPQAVQCQISLVFQPETSEIPAENQYDLAFLAYVPPYGARTYDVVGLWLLDATAKNENSTLCSFAHTTIIEKPISDSSIVRDEVVAGVLKIDRFSKADLLVLSSAAFLRLLTMETAFLRIRLDPTSGMIAEVARKSLEKKNNFASTDADELSDDPVVGIAHKLKVDFVSYTARAGGAYLFLPDSKPNEFEPKFEMLRLTQGALFSEAMVVKQQKFLHTYVRLYNSPGIDGQSVEIENHVDMSDAAALNNREVVMLIKTDLNNTEPTNSNQPVMYTDLNGYQMIKRVTMLKKLPVQGNFFPMPSIGFIENSSWRLTVLGSQPLGVASLASGEMQIVLDRRLAQDDNKGLNQAVQDNKAETSSRFKLIFEFLRVGKNESQANRQSYPSLTGQRISLSLLHPPLIYFFSNNSVAVQKAHEEKDDEATTLIHSLLFESLPKSLEFSALSAPLSCDMHLLNIRTEVAVEDSGKTFEPSPFALVLLQRFGVECSVLPAYKLTCPGSLRNGRINLAEVFAEFSHQSWTLIEHKNLSPLHKGRMMNASEEVWVETMDINCFKVPLAVDVVRKVQE